ncbi:hypothetical protein CLIB1444_08S01948 [[Candida] jaroonii]|uniref:Uncharacterized protein n=1 Tax=[Candida] jaroonii TaxID=467808 RepID=A0ACA9YAN3_9ASCO|nr:hypothetical protein CLIB1444_08S01948 [[Candida] jaroonii]
MNEELINDKLHLSKLYFKSNDYRNALKTYTELILLIESYSLEDLKKVNEHYNYNHPISTFHPKLISILDQRAATYEKLNLLDKALRDGEKILKINSFDVKGYLRIGKIHKLRNDHLKCFKIYQTGVYTIRKFKEKYPEFKFNRDLWHKLVSNYNEINSFLKSDRNSKPPEPPLKKPRIKNLDPLNYLNYDVIEHVFELLPNTYKYHLVCKNWYQTLKLLRLNRSVQLKSRILSREFANGIPYFKTLKELELTMLPTNDTEFYRVVELIVNNRLKISKFEIFKIIKLNMLFSKFDKFNFNFGFKNIRSFKSYVDKSPHNLIIHLFPNLTHLELIIKADNSKDHDSLVINNKSLVRKLYDNVPPIETLVLISNLKQPIPFLSYSFNLTKLVIVNFNFENIQHKFGIFLQRCSNLKDLILENNDDFSFKMFMNNLINYKSDFKLNYLMFREYSISLTSLSEFELSDFNNLTELTKLDLYSTSLTNRGLLKLLGVTKNLQSLVLGSSNYLFFKNDIINNYPKISLIEILERCCKLKHISLVDLNLDNVSCRKFNHDLTNFSKIGQVQGLTLELSFNVNINGIGLFNLLSKIDAIRVLVIDGISINQQSLQLIERNYGVLVKNDPLLIKWRRFGVNSYVLD